MGRHDQSTRSLETSRFDFDVFLSHNSDDKPIVRPLAERLRKDGLKVWYDEWQIKPGDSISGKVGDGLTRSRVLLMLLSRNFDDSDWTRYEGAPFLFSDPTNQQRRFIPVRLDDSEVPFRLKDFLWIDWRQQADEPYRKLLEACRPELVDRALSI